MRQKLLKRRCPRKKKEKEEKKTPKKQRQSVQVPEDAEFLDEIDDGGLHWTEADFMCLVRAWVTASIQTMSRTKGFTFYQKVNIVFNRDLEFPTRRSSGSTKSQWYTLNSQCVAYKRIVAQERFRHYSGKTEEDRANLRDDGLNYAGNIPRNVARRTSDNSFLGNSVGSNNLSEDPGGQLTPQSVGPNAELDNSLYEGGNKPKTFRKNLAAQKALDGVAASGTCIQTMLDELQLEKR
ncbi:hypothetical protein GIB67_034111 [Kingdonia uniflora]|uniref:Uncharacterized protein n=1 Tax=Kingdonia uniflora TaxID=39325 RepID=A0A7J7M6E4_9MAGN|nr:hypothetical protein GIB67_034111 [Kingdonia uniflora]